MPAVSLQGVAASVGVRTMNGNPAVPALFAGIFGFAVAFAISSTLTSGASARATPPACVPPYAFFPNDQMIAAAPGGSVTAAPRARKVVDLLALRWLITIVPEVAAGNESPQSTPEGGDGLAATENSFDTL